MRILPLYPVAPCDLREKVIELLVLRAKVAELEKARGHRSEAPYLLKPEVEPVALPAARCRRLHGPHRSVHRW